jgi:hypothetical protein
MNTQFDTDFFADTGLFAGETEVPIAVWTIDELDQYADLDSVRTARLRARGGSLWHAE